MARDLDKVYLYVESGIDTGLQVQYVNPVYVANMDWQSLRLKEKDVILGFRKVNSNSWK